MELHAKIAGKVAWSNVKLHEKLHLELHEPMFDEEIKNNNHKHLSKVG